MLIYSISEYEQLYKIPIWAHWVELRTDLDESLYEAVPALSKYMVILTERCVDEGGESTRSINDKINKFSEYFEYDYVWYDIEIHELRSPQQLDIFPDRKILSFHNYFRYSDFYIKKKLINSYIHQANYLKLAQQLNSFLEIKEFFEMNKNINPKLMIIPMGKYSKFLRILSHHLACSSNYVVEDGKETVEGQITSSDVEQYQLNEITSDWKWGGIIGGKQVFNSIGLNFYNHYFKEHNIEAVYLPIPLEKNDIANFFSFIENHPILKQKCYGFSITMPYKSFLPSLYNEHKIVNLMDYQASKFYNTDLEAFIKIKETLSQSSIKSVLIYGSGNMAKLAAQVFSGWAISITSRNVKKLIPLSEDFPSIEIIDQNIKHRYFDLLINCSSLGMNGEDFCEVTGLNNFKYVIDLPYSKQEVALESYVDNDKYISGRTFWKYQAKTQLNIFIRSINNG